MAPPPNGLTAVLGNELPPFLALPLEIKQDIFAYLHGCTEPTLAILRRTHSSFYHIIPRSDLRSISARRLRIQLKNAEATYPYLLPPGHYTCFDCLCVLPRNSFSDNGTRRGKGLGNSKAHLRYCLCCGVTKGWYDKQTTLTVGGVKRSTCYSCGHFLLDVPFEESRRANCRAHAGQLAELERDIFQAKIDRLKARAQEDKVEALDDWWYRTWARRGRIACDDGDDDDDWLPDETLPAPGQAENLSILTYLRLH